MRGLSSAGFMIPAFFTHPNYIFFLTVDMKPSDSYTRNPSFLRVCKSPTKAYWEHKLSPDLLAVYFQTDWRKP